MSREDRAAETLGHLFGGGEAHGRLTGGAGAYGPAVVVFLYQLLQERVSSPGSKTKSAVKTTEHAEI